MPPTGNNYEALRSSALLQLVTDVSVSICCPETSVANRQTTPCNIRPQPHRGESLKSGLNPTQLRWYVLVLKMQSVYCELGTEFIHIIYVNFVLHMVVP